ncbi:MAG TPA: hypothetical protein VE962_00250, partial [Actinomycetota bacterium]|nr:hypothetical protein [Actinomycetota bacterium]
TLPIKWPSSIVYGEGSIWVAAWVEETDGNLLYRIAPDTGAILAEIPVPSIPGWETGGGGMVAADGSVWIAGLTQREDEAALLRVEAATNELADVIPLGGDFAGDVALDEHGIWVTVFAEPSVELLRLDPSTLAVESRTALGTDWAREILAIDGTIWVRVLDEDDEVTGDPRRLLFRIDPKTGQIVDRVHVPGAVTNVTAGGGTIWVTASRSSGNLIARVDPTTGDVSTTPSGELDYFPEFGEGGLWARGLDRSTGRLLVVRYNQVSGRVDARAVLPERLDPIDLAVAPGSVWVASYEEGVTRVELRPA